MVYFPKNSGTRLIQARAIDGDFPFYGTIEMVDGSDIIPFRNGIAVLIDESLAIQYDVQVRDSLKLGKGTFLITASLQLFPGPPASMQIYSQRVSALQRLEETGLIQYGSRVNYHKYLKVKEGELASIKERLDPLMENMITALTMWKKERKISGGDSAIYTSSLISSVLLH
jgi:putative ABC transport system permease protein